VDNEHPFRSVFSAGARLDPINRAAQVGRICGIVAVQLGSTHQLIPLLRLAERDDRALNRALEIINVLPTRQRRHLIATFGRTEWAIPGRRRIESSDEPIGRFSDLPPRGAESASRGGGDA
jgi:hypothetical protein